MLRTRKFFRVLANGIGISTFADVAEVLADPPNTVPAPIVVSWPQMVWLTTRSDARINQLTPSLPSTRLRNSSPSDSEAAPSIVSAPVVAMVTPFVELSIFFRT